MRSLSSAVWGNHSSISGTKLETQQTNLSSLKQTSGTRDRRRLILNLNATTIEVDSSIETNLNIQESRSWVDIVWVCWRRGLFCWGRGWWTSWRTTCCCRSGQKVACSPPCDSVGKGSNCNDKWSSRCCSFQILH